MIALFQSLAKIYDHSENGTNIDLNTKNFAFPDSFRFKTTKCCKARLAAIALPDRTSNSSSSLPSFVNSTPSYLNFSTYFNDTPPTCRKDWTGFLKRCSTSVLEILIFIPAMSHAAANSFNTCWRSDTEEASKTKSSAESNRLISHLPIVTHSSVQLSLYIQFNYTASFTLEIH